MIHRVFLTRKSDQRVNGYNLLIRLVVSASDKRDGKCAAGELLAILNLCSKMLAVFSAWTDVGLPDAIIVHSCGELGPCTSTCAN